MNFFSIPQIWSQFEADAAVQPERSQSESKSPEWGGGRESSLRHDEWYFHIYHCFCCAIPGICQKCQKQCSRETTKREWDFEYKQSVRWLGPDNRKTWRSATRGRQREAPPSDLGQWPPDMVLILHKVDFREAGVSPERGIPANQKPTSYPTDCAL